MALVGHHLRWLGAADLAESTRDGKMVFHSLTPHERQLLDAHLCAVRVR